ncbi:MAG TPA: hypothetical protein VFK13_10410 [Gemmatimonadaceae bacterium]|nr:hypothetical protein [Gemmatimonadaceae bacterium]
MLAVSLLAAAALAAHSPAPPSTGEELVRLMHDRYAGQWYHTATFVQTTIMEDGSEETWYEAMMVPGRLRIDIAPLDSAHAIIFANDTMTEMRGGQVTRAVPLVHPLMVLGFDVYADAPEATLAKLRGLGFDLSTLHEDTWQGRPVYVVGANAGDARTNQFWIDKERLVFVRMIRSRGNVVQETQFNAYEPLGKGWMSAEVVFMTNGKVVTTEKYADIRGDVPLPDSLFNTSTYARPEWVSP